MSIRAYSGIAAAALFAAALFLPRPAAAQITLGSPGDPPRLALGVGGFDILPGKHPHDGAAGEFRGEYRFGDVLYAFSPFLGASVTTRGGTYEYFGFGFDINFGPDWVLTPNGAAGIYERGGGTKLGSWWEFRTGAELDYRLADRSRIGLAFHHMSNAGLTQYNPGEESITLVYTIPLP